YPGRIEDAQRGRSGYQPFRWISPIFCSKHCAPAVSGNHTDRRDERTASILKAIGTVPAVARKEEKKKTSRSKNTVKWRTTVGHIVKSSLQNLNAYCIQDHGRKID